MSDIVSGPIAVRACHQLLQIRIHKTRTTVRTLLNFEPSHNRLKICTTLSTCTQICGFGPFGVTRFSYTAANQPHTLSRAS
jgi:hypothetical protein